MLNDNYSKEKWIFEAVVHRGRRCTEYGKPYSALATITITNGEAHVEGLIAKTKFTKEDVLEIEEKIRKLGYKYYITSDAHNDGERVLNKVML